VAQLIEHQELVSVLQGFNPWWAGRALPVPTFRRLAFEACRTYLTNPTLKRAVLLSGPRRVGKTTVLYQLAEDLLASGVEARSILYLSLDHPVLKLLGLRDILDLYHQHIHAEDRPAVLLLDEVQYSREWETEIKLLVDHKPNYRIVATGSASVVHRERLAESGVGRWVTVPVPTLSFYEFIHIRGETPPAVEPALRPKDPYSPPRARILAASRCSCVRCFRCFSATCWLVAFPKRPARTTSICASVCCARTWWNACLSAT